MSENETINSSLTENNNLYKEWHKWHHRHACHHKGEHLKDVEHTFLLLGTPNVGKSTFFNKITTSTASVSNIDRLTVEDTMGQYRHHKDIALVDLPGIYNLSHPIDEEKVVSHELYHEHFEKIINIIGAQSIERDLLLTLQCIETGKLSLIVINMVDEVIKDGINFQLLSQQLNNIKVVSTQANRNKGIVEAEVASISAKCVNSKIVKYSNEIETYISKISKYLPTKKVSKRFYSLMLLEGNEHYKQALQHHYPELYEKINKVIGDKNFYKEIMDTKRNFIKDIINKSTKVHQSNYLSFNRPKQYKTDRLLLNKWLGIPAFLLLMVAIYFISFSPWTGGALQKLITDDLFNNLIANNIHQAINGWNSSGGIWTVSLITDGILNGFFAVISFIPVIFILFFLVNIINQVGILSRISVLLDKTFEKFGLSGRSIVNLLTGFGCNVPAIMMARSTNSKKERIISILIAPFIACSARVIVFSFVCNLLFHQWGWVGMILLTISSGLIALLIALFFSKTMFRKTKSFFIIEMVSWRKPDFVIIFKSIWIQLKEFIKKASTMIVVASLIVWLLLNIFPTQPFDKWHNVTDQDGNWTLQINMSDSLLGYASRGLQYIFVPIGFGNIGSGALSEDGWKLTASMLSALPAKEIAIANIEMLYGNNFNVSIPQGLSYLIMIMIAVPCVATISILKKEGGYKNMFISMGTSFLTAYLLAGIVYWISFGLCSI